MSHTVRVSVVERRQQSEHVILNVVAGECRIKRFVISGINEFRDKRRSVCRPITYNFLLQTIKLLSLETEMLVREILESEIAQNKVYFIFRHFKIT